MNWPIGSDKNFKGVYNRAKQQIEMFNDSNHGQNIAKIDSGDLSDPKYKEMFGADLHKNYWMNLNY